MSSTPSTPSKAPRQVVGGVFAFPPNRDTMGGTAYLIQEAGGNILVDAPPWDEGNQAGTREFLQGVGGVRWLFLTHRGGIGKAQEVAQTFGSEIVMQEQEAYLLPDVAVTTFEQEFRFSPLSRALWTPGHSPGSACLYHQTAGGILFTGRHLLPDRQGQPVPLRISKTFHWGRQLRSVQKLRDLFSSETLHYLCPGANTGFLRGERAIAHAYEKLVALDLESLAHMQPGL